jgi:hypothetical protein
MAVDAHVSTSPEPGALNLSRIAMSKQLLTAAIHTLLASLVASPLLAQTKPAAPPQKMSTTIAPWWEMIEKTFVSAAEAMPADRWTFKPTNGAFENARTFAEQVKHVACANEAFFNEIAGKEPPPDCEKGGPNPAKSKGELVAYLRTTFEQGRKAIAGLTPSNALDYAGGPYGGETPLLLP